MVIVRPIESQNITELPTTQLTGQYAELNLLQEQSSSSNQNPHLDTQQPGSRFWRFDSSSASSSKNGSTQNLDSKTPAARKLENPRQPSWRSIRRFSPTTSSRRGSGTEVQSNKSLSSVRKSTISGPVLTSTTNIKIAATEGVNATPLRIGELSGSSDSKSEPKDSTQLDRKTTASSSRPRLANLRNTISGSSLFGDLLNSPNKRRDSKAFAELSRPVAKDLPAEKQGKRRASHLFNLGKKRINNLAESCGIRHPSLNPRRRHSLKHRRQKSWSSAVKTSDSYPFSDSMRELLSQSLPRRRSLLQPSNDDLSLEKSFSDAVDKLDFLASKEDFRVASVDGTMAEGEPPR